MCIQNPGASPSSEAGGIGLDTSTSWSRVGLALARPASLALIFLIVVVSGLQLTDLALRNGSPDLDGRDIGLEHPIVLLPDRFAADSLDSIDVQIQARSRSRVEVSFHLYFRSPPSSGYLEVRLPRESGNPQASSLAGVDSFGVAHLDFHAIEPAEIRDQYGVVYQFDLGGGLPGYIPLSSDGRASVGYAVLRFDVGGAMSRSGVGRWDLFVSVSEVVRDAETVLPIGYIEQIALCETCGGVSLDEITPETQRRSGAWIWRGDEIDRGPLVIIGQATGGPFRWILDQWVWVSGLLVSGLFVLVGAGLRSQPIDARGSSRLSGAKRARGNPKPRARSRRS